jgi:predicted Zn-dependent peptidase
MALTQVPSKYSGRVLQLLTYGALYPNFTQEEFDKEKRNYLKRQEKKTLRQLLTGLLML